MKKLRSLDTIDASIVKIIQSATVTFGTKLLLFTLPMLSGLNNLDMATNFTVVSISQIYNLRSSSK